MWPAKLDVKKYVSRAGTVLMLISLVFIARRLIDYNPDFSLLTSPVVVAGLFGVAMTEGLGIMGASINFRALIKNVSMVLVARPLVMSVYSASNLFKYIPGGVLYVVGRNRLAIETEELSHGKVMFATVAEGIFIVIGALSISVLLSFEHTMTYIGRLDVLPVVLLVLGMILVVAVPIAYLNRARINAGLLWLRSTSEILSFSVLAKRLGFAFLLMFLFSVTFTATLALLGQPMTLELTLTIIGLYLLAWLAGFLTPGAPSGLGIREAVMLMFIGGLVNENLLLSAMIIHRVVTMIGDIFAYVISISYEKRMVVEKVG